MANDAKTTKKNDDEDIVVDDEGDNNDVNDANDNNANNNNNDNAARKKEKKSKSVPLHPLPPPPSPAGEAAKRHQWTYDESINIWKGVQVQNYTLALLSMYVCVHLCSNLCIITRWSNLLLILSHSEIRGR